MIAIGICADRHYLVPALVTLTSISESHGAGLVRKMSINILSPDVSSSEAMTVKSVVRHLGFKQCFIRKVPLPQSRIVHGDYISRTTYLRFAFNEALIAEPFFLYIDSDVLVLGDLTDPFNIIGSNSIGAVIDEINHTVGKGPALPNFSKDYPSFLGAGYYNAGILWIPKTNVNRVMRGARIALKYKQYIHFNDQDALNIWMLSSNSSVELHPKLNRFELARLQEESDWVNRVVKFPRTDQDANALHFIGPKKPWLRLCPSTDGVRKYRSMLKITKRLINRTRDVTMELKRD